MAFCVVTLGRRAPPCLCLAPSLYYLRNPSVLLAFLGIFPLESIVAMRFGSILGLASISSELMALRVVWGHWTQGNTDLEPSMSFLRKH